MALNAYGNEVARVAAYNAVYKRIEIQNGSGTVLGKADVPPDTVDGTPDQAGKNKSAIVITPTVSGTAATVKTFNTAGSGGAETSSTNAADVLKTAGGTPVTNIVAGEPVTIPVGELGVVASL